MVLDYYQTTFFLHWQKFCVWWWKYGSTRRNNIKEGKDKYVSLSGCHSFLENQLASKQDIRYITGELLRLYTLSLFLKALDPTMLFVNCFFLCAQKAQSAALQLVVLQYWC